MKQINDDLDVADPPRDRKVDGRRHEPNTQQVLRKVLIPILVVIAPFICDYSKGESMSNSASTDGK